jgi:hypothetical protein
VLVAPIYDHDTDTEHVDDGGKVAGRCAAAHRAIANRPYDWAAANVYSALAGHGFVDSQRSSR